MKLNYAYPKGMMGFHSGWSDYNDDVTRVLSLTKRLPVRISSYPYEPLVGSNSLPDFYIKTKDGSKTALTSGAGGIVMRHNGTYYKIKRCGYKDRGFIKNAIRDRAIQIKDSMVVESVYQEHGGAMTLEDIFREQKMEKVLSEAGFLVPQRMVGIYRIKLPFDTGVDEYGAAIFEIDSDFRCDELCTAIAVNTLSSFISDGVCEYNASDGRFEFTNALLNNCLDTLEDNCGEILRRIGSNIGKIYHDLHSFGFVRGVGNAWYGNEVLMPDGSIGICDLESSFLESEISNPSLLNRFKRNDINTARTAIFSSLGSFENTVLDIIADMLIEGFEDGYNSGNTEKLDVEEIEKVLNEFHRSSSVVSGGF